MHRYDLTDAQWRLIEPFFPDRYHSGGAGHPWKDHRPLVNGILWHMHTGAPGLTSRSVTAPGRRSMTASTAGVRMALGPGSSTPFCSVWTRGGSSTANCGASMPPSSEPAGRPPGRKKNPDPPPRLGGSKRTQMLEPTDHALGRLRGGFGTKVHLVCDRRGLILAVFVTAGQRHESKAFEPVMLRVRCPRLSGRKRWPARVAADKGYSYPRVRSWLWRHRIEDVIPTRKNQPRDEAFDKATYRRRNIIERVVGWFKECRALGTRYDKLAVNYVALWMVAIIHYLLRKRRKGLQMRLSERT